MKRVLAVAVAGLLAFAGVALASTNGTYKGKPAHGKKLSLRVAGGKVAFVSFVATFSCGGTKELEQTNIAAGAKVSHSKFSISATITAAPLRKHDHLSITGHFNGDKVTGTLSQKFVYHGTTCQTGTQKYSAKR
jgi:hypothetical protein